MCAGVLMALRLSIFYSPDPHLCLILLYVPWGPHNEALMLQQSVHKPDCLSLVSKGWVTDC